MYNQQTATKGLVLVLCWGLTIYPMARPIPTSAQTVSVKTRVRARLPGVQTQVPRIRVNLLRTTVLAGPSIPLLNASAINPSLTAPDVVPAPTLSMPVVPASIKPSGTPVVTAEAPIETAIETLKSSVETRSESGREAFSAAADGSLLDASSLDKTLPVDAGVPLKTSGGKISGVLKKYTAPGVVTRTALAAAGSLLSSPALASSLESSHAEAGFSGKIAAVVGLGVLGRWFFGKRDKGTQDTPDRDVKLTNDLLQDVWRLKDALEESDTDLFPNIASLAESVIVGDYQKVRRLLQGIESAKLEPGIAGERDRLAAALRRKLPAKDAPAMKALKRALKAVRDSLSPDPFHTQRLLSRIVRGIDHNKIPNDLQDKQMALTRKASAIARDNAHARREKTETVEIQRHEDCWVQSLYHLPVPFMAALRDSMSYEAFLSRVEIMFPEKDVKGDGLGPEEFDTLLSRLGLSRSAHITSENQLKALLDEHGSVIAAAGWFDKDVEGIDIIQALKHWHQHAMIITGYEDAEGETLFKVRDSLVPSLVRYTKTELDLMTFTVFVVEADKSTPARIEEFLRDES